MSIVFVKYASYISYICVNLLKMNYCMVVLSSGIVISLSKNMCLTFIHQNPISDYNSINTRMIKN